MLCLCAASIFLPSSSTRFCDYSHSRLLFQVIWTLFSACKFSYSLANAFNYFKWNVSVCNSLPFFMQNMFGLFMKWLKNRHPSVRPEKSNSSKTINETSLKPTNANAKRQCLDSIAFFSVIVVRECVCFVTAVDGKFWIRISFDETTHLRSITVDEWFVYGKYVHNWTHARANVSYAWWIKPTITILQH